jgi:hypothetical protein
MASNKTVPTDGSVQAFLESVEHDGRRADAFEMLDMMAAATGEPARLWGPSIVGFGQYHYRYESGREGDWALTGFSPRKANLVVYITPGFSAYGDLMERLGKVKTGRSCLYITRLDKIDRAVLRELVARSVADMRAKYGA